MADAQVSEACAARCEGSTPSLRTKLEGGTPSALNEGTTYGTNEMSEHKSFARINPDSCG